MVVIVNGRISQRAPQSVEVVPCQGHDPVQTQSPIFLVKIVPGLGQLLKQKSAICNRVQVSIILAK